MKLFVAVVMFVIVPVVLAGDAAWEMANPQEQLLWHRPPSTKQKTEPQQETSKAQALPSAPPPPPITQDNLTSDQKKKPTENQPKQVNNFWWKRENFWPPSFADWAQVVGAAVVAYIGLRTLKQIEKQIRVAALGVKVSRRAAKASEISAAAALKSADVALLQAKIMENRERPWIMVIPDNPEGGFPVGGTQPFLFRFRWLAKNVGSSPAFMTRLYAITCTIDLSIPDQEPPYRQDLEDFAKFILPPGGVHEGRTWANLSPAEIEGYVSGRKCIMFYGLIEYDGAFSGPHRTRFCCYWEKQSGANRFNPVGPPKTVEYT